MSDILEWTLHRIYRVTCYRKGNFLEMLPNEKGKLSWGSSFNETKNFKLIVVEFIQTFSLIEGKNLSWNIQISGFSFKIGVEILCNLTWVNCHIC